MASPESIHSQAFDQHADFDPAGDFEGFLKAVPGKWVVYLLADVDDLPIQLLCVRNLRDSLKRRLGGDELVGPGRRIKYREIVRKLHWRRVDSAFEADLAYYEAARLLFPQSYQGMVGFRPAWFVHVNPAANFPRFVKTIDLKPRPGTLLGPLDDKHAAARFIELLEDSFDLCRFYNILVEAPNGQACAYKGMGKCPAPCDGSISLDQYRNLITLSVKTALDPADYIREQTRRMQAAATELRFELAAKIKAYVDQLSQLGKSHFRHVAALADFQFLAFQRGPKAKTVKIFLITPGRVENVVDLIREPDRPGDVLRLALELAAERTATGVDDTGAERIGVVSHHLFSSKQTHGVFLPLTSVDEKAIAKAYKDLQKQKAPEDVEGEGVMKELQAI